jgi:REP element-mobilizing transposase RayT
MSSYPTRRRQRLRDYPYAMPGFYFVTLCIQDRLPLLGRVTSSEMHASAAGDMVKRRFEEACDQDAHVHLDALVVMPDHLHAVVWLDGEGRPLSALVQAFKARTTADYVLGVRSWGWAAFRGRLWQKGFYDRVIRGDEELAAIRDYVMQNPRRWGLNEEAE